MLGTVNSGGSSPLDLYESLEVIGHGSFGIVRKVRRKSDGEVLARKELGFAKLSESDRKKIMVEANVLKDLRHENIVRYIDQFVDNDTGILYILMEYCEGGDLSSIINQREQDRFEESLSEDIIWSYLLQLLLALDHCHNPGSRISGDGSIDGNLQQILHRDLKPGNVFIGKGGILKLGDFGLSKALDQTSFTDTFVGTPFYMSPELFQKVSYDTKADIWSLGCLMYELCALKPLFHSARTYDDLKTLIHTGSIPPLPECYSQALDNVIKSMLNVNPKTRPSTQQLLQHERVHLTRKLADQEKIIKAHESRTSYLQACNDRLDLQVVDLLSCIREKDMEIARLKMLNGLQQKTWLDKLKELEEAVNNDQQIALEPGSSKLQKYDPMRISASAQFLSGQVPVYSVRSSLYGSSMSIVGFSSTSPMSIVQSSPASPANGSPMTIG